MNKRKSELRALLAVNPNADTVQTNAAPASKRSASGAVKAMGLSLGSLAREADEAKRLRDSIEDGDRIVKLDPALIETSLIIDRIDDAYGEDQAFEALKASIAESGQQVPVLVRRHPDPVKAGQGWYQAAYGHRRIRATAALGISVNAVVRQLDDNDLLVAQGKENSERLDLSYIERAMFAQAIITAGYDRKTAQRALSVDKTEMSRMIQVVGSVPEQFERAIGSAPKVGRPRWVAMGELLSMGTQRNRAAQLIDTVGLTEIDSNGRCKVLFDALSKPKQAKKSGGTAKIHDQAGRLLGRLTHANGKTTLELTGINHAAFAEFVAG